MFIIWGDRLMNKGVCYNNIFLFQFRILRSQLAKNPSILEDATSKPNMTPDMYALQQMKALQVAQNPALKALVDARGM